MPNWKGRILTGAWIETPMCSLWLRLPGVASSRVRELKLMPGWLTSTWKGRILTGAWIETILHASRVHSFLSHPHGCVNWNHKRPHFEHRPKVASSRVRELKLSMYALAYSCRGRILTGAWIETGTILLFLESFWVASSRVRELKPKVALMKQNNIVASSRVRELKHV